MDKVKTLEILINLIKENKINSFYIIDEIANTETRIDILNLNDKKIQNFLNKIKQKQEFKIRLNSKNEKKFFKLYKKSFTPDKISEIFFMRNKGEYKVIAKNGRVIEFDISEHAFNRFVERLLIFYKVFGHRKFDVSKKLKEQAKQIEEFIKNKTLIKNKEKVKNLIIEYIENATPLKEKSLYRIKDKVNMKRRAKQYEDENKVLKLVSHPFLFIINVEEGILKTIELYSSSFPFIDLLNKKSREFEKDALLENGVDFGIYLNNLHKWVKFFKNNKKNKKFLNFNSFKRK